MANARNLIMNMTPKGRLMLAGSAAAVLLLAFFMIRIAGQASYSTVMAGIDPKQTSKITAALDAKGIKYEIQNNGTALAVDKSQIGQARIALAEKGLPGSAQPGFELFNSQKLGASDFQQQVTYERALDGQLLWPNSAGGATDGQMAATAKQAAEARYSQGIESNLNALLLQTLGPGKAQVQVNADLNADRTTLQKLTYAKKGIPLTTQKETETLKGTGTAGAGGAAGAATNTVPSYAGAAGGAGSNYKHTTGQTQWGVGKQLTRTVVAPGAVNKMNVSVLVDSSVPPRSVAAIRQS